MYVCMFLCMYVCICISRCGQYTSICMCNSRNVFRLGSRRKVKKIYFTNSVSSDESDCSLSPTIARIQTLPGASRAVASDLGSGGGYSRILRFPPSLTVGLSR